MKRAVSRYLAHGIRGANHEIQTMKEVETNV
jgi:hypothetical protein